MSEGLQTRYRVEKIDDPEGKHSGDQYFVLDPAHDVHSIEALRAYARSIRGENSALADDLVNWADQMTDLQGEDAELSLEEERAEYLKARERLHRQQRTLLDIWHATEPGDTKYMTYGTDTPEYVMASVSAFIRRGQSTIDGLLAKIVNAFEDSEEDDDVFDVRDRLFASLGIKETDA